MIDILEFKLRLQVRKSQHSRVLCFPENLFMTTYGN